MELLSPRGALDTGLGWSKVLAVGEEMQRRTGNSGTGDVWVAECRVGGEQGWMQVLSPLQGLGEVASA